MSDVFGAVRPVAGGVAATQHDAPTTVQPIIDDDVTQPRDEQKRPHAPGLTLPHVDTEPPGPRVRDDDKGTEQWVRPDNARRHSRQPSDTAQDPVWRGAQRRTGREAFRPTAPARPHTPYREQESDADDAHARELMGRLPQVSQASEVHAVSASDTIPSMDSYSVSAAHHPRSDRTDPELRAVAGPASQQVDTRMVSPSAVAQAARYAETRAVAPSEPLAPEEPEDLILISIDIEAIEDSAEEAVAPPPPRPAPPRQKPARVPKVAEAYELTGVHVVEELGDIRRDLPDLLGRIGQVSQAVRMPRYTRRIIEELCDELASSNASAIELTGVLVHEVAEALWRALPGEQLDVAQRADELAVTAAPDFLPSHFSLLAHAFKERNWPAYAERLERFGERLEVMVQQNPAARDAFAVVLVELELVQEFLLGGRPDACWSLAKRAARYAESYALAAINAVRLALARKAKDDVVASLRQLIHATSTPLQGAIAFELAVYLWTDAGDLAGALAVANEYLSGRLDAYPYALQLLAWQAGDEDLEIGVSKARVKKLVAEGKATKQGDKARRRELKLATAAIFHRLFEVHTRRGDFTRATKALQDGLRLLPGDLLLLERAVEVGHEAGDWQVVDGLLETLWAAVTDPRRRAAIAHRRARVACDQMGDGAKARRHLLEALETDAAHVPAAIDLGRVFLAKRLYEPTYELWTSLASTADAEGWCWPNHNDQLRRADLIEHLLRRDDEALVAYGEALAMRPDDRAAQRGVIRLALRREDYERVFSVLRSAAALPASPQRTRDIAWQRAQLLERVLGKRADAITAYQQWLVLVPDDTKVRLSIAHLLRREGRYEDAAKAIAAALPVVSDPSARRQSIEWMAFLASLGWAGQEGTARALEALLEESPESPVSHALMRVSMLAARDWNGFEAYCVRMAAEVSGTRRRDLLFQAALVARSQLNDNQRARRHLEAAREMDPLWPPALDLLEEIYGEEGDEEALVQVLVDRASVSEPSTRARLLESAASLSVDRLDDFALAEKLYREAHDADPKDLAAWAGLCDVLRAREAWDEVAKLLRQRADTVHDKEEKLLLLHELAFVQAFHLHAAEQARATSQEVVDSTPDDIVSLRMLADMHRQLGDWAGLAATHGRLADVLVDNDDRTFHLLEQTKLEAHMHGRVHFERIEHLIRVAGHAVLPRLLAHVAIARDAKTHLIAALSARPPARHDLQRAMDAYQVGQLCEEAKQLEAARKAYLEVASIRPDFLPAQIAIVRVLDGLAEHSEGARRCMAVARAIEPGDKQLPLLQGAAQRWARAGKPEQQAEALELVLNLAPDDEQTFDTLRHYYQSVGDVEHLSRLLARRTDAESVAARIDMLRQIARSLQVEAGSPTYRRSVEELVELLPGDYEAQQRLAQLDEIESRFEPAAKRWELVLGLAPDAATYRIVALRVADLWREHCHAPERAVQRYADLLHRDPTDLVALEGIARAHVDTAEVDAAVVAYRRLFSLAQDVAVRVRVGLALGALFRDAVADFAESARWFVAVGELDPTCDAAVEALIRLGGAQVGSTAHAGGPTLAVEQLDKAISAQLDALREDRWAMARYEKLALLLRLRDEDDVRVATVGSALRKLGRLPQELVQHLDAWERTHPVQLPQGSLSAEDYTQHLLHPWCRGPVYELFARIGEHLGRVEELSIARLGAVDETPIGFDDPHGLARKASAMARALGMGSPAVYMHPSDPRAAAFAFAPQSALVLGIGLLADDLADANNTPRRAQDLLRLAVSLESLRGAKAVAGRLSPDALHGILYGALRGLFPDLEVRQLPPGGVATPDVEKGTALAMALPRRKRRELRQLAEAAASTTWETSRWLLGVRLTIARAGLVACGDLGAAADVFVGPPPASTDAKEWRAVVEMGDLLEFALTDGFALLRRRVLGGR